MTILPILWRQARLTLQDRRGASAIEFAIVCPVFLLMLFAILGYGITGLIQLALDDAVRDAARQLQMNTPASASASGFLAAVCGLRSAVCGLRRVQRRRDQLQHHAEL